MLLKCKARPYPSRRRCATKVFRRAFQQKSGSAPVTPFFQWAVIIPFHFSVRYKQKVQEFFLSAPKSCMHTTSHPGSGFQSNTPGAPLAHRAFLNVLIQELKQSKAWVQAKAPPHHSRGPPGQDCCLAHAVKQQKSSAATHTGAHRHAGLTRAGTKTHSRCGRRRSVHGTSTQALGYLCTNNGKFYD